MKRLTDHLTVSGQVRPQDMAALKAAGVTWLINNRPDGEEPGQPESADLRAAAESEGLGYAEAPTKGRPTEEAVTVLRTALASGETVHAFCRTGTRSTFAWAVMATHDGVAVEDVAEAARAAGYDVTPLFA